MSASLTVSSKLSFVSTSVASGGGFQSGCATSFTRSTIAATDIRFVMLQLLIKNISCMIQVPTLFCPLSIVVHRLPVFNDLDGGITRHFKPTSQTAGRRSVNFGHRNRWVILLQALCDFLILRYKLFAVATPSNGQTKGRFMLCRKQRSKLQSRLKPEESQTYQGA